MARPAHLEQHDDASLFALGGSRQCLVAQQIGERDSAGVGGRETVRKYSSATISAIGFLSLKSFATVPSGWLIAVCNSGANIRNSTCDRFGSTRVSHVQGVSRRERPNMSKKSFCSA